MTVRREGVRPGDLRPDGQCFGLHPCLRDPSPMQKLQLAAVSDK